MIPAPKRGGEVVNVIEHPATDHTKDPANKKARKQFHSIVLNWSYSSGRDFPWRVTSNPFHILVAEVLLRQTQSEITVIRIRSEVLVRLVVLSNTVKPQVSDAAPIGARPARTCHSHAGY